MREQWSADRPVLLYGAGNTGQAIAQSLKAEGVDVVAFLDAAARPAEIRAGLPIYSVSDWLAGGKSADHDVLVAIHNPYSNVLEITKELRRSGFSRVFTMVDYANRFPNGAENRYWLAPSKHYAGSEDQLNTVAGLLADESSRRCFESTMRLRINGEYGVLPPAPVEEQYVPADLPRWSEPMRLIDCGAFDGDTIESLIRNRYAVEAVAAFEPDLQNYLKLATRFSQLNAVFLPCGVSSSTSLVRFDGGQGTSSRIDEHGGVAIQCVTIDDCIPAFAPTLIKMDIEGAEPGALRGAERTIRRYRPALALSLYHAPQHLWEIPLWVAGLSLKYQMYIRSYAHNGFELVLYCRPL